VKVFEQFAWYAPVAHYTDGRLRAVDRQNLLVVDPAVKPTPPAGSPESEEVQAAVPVPEGTASKPNLCGCAAVDAPWGGLVGAALVALVAFVVGTSATAQAGWSNGRTLLHLSAGYGCLPVVEKLLALGVDPNVLDTGGHSPLYRAAGVNGDAAVVRALVDAGGIVDQAGGVSRSTPLHVAARFGNVAVAAALLAAGADTKLKDKTGFTAYDRAVRCRRNEVAKLLSRSA
jgi:hypothetical protein